MANGDGCDKKEDKGSEIIAAQGEKEQIKSKKKRIFGGYKLGVQKAKKAMLFPFRNFQKHFSRPPLSSSSSCSVSYKNSNLSSGKRRVATGLFCCLCLSRPGTLEKGLSQSHSYEYIRSMIEKNDFYSKGCNTHLGG